ncbi:hypothetical protein MVEN_01264000 [Mycena venus]|uniref:Uncharacterized protein n=1 Tax=Mycena venus TaxID=2733690 RepID=A0A8H6Y6A8_9AGAR|nr:hypothetical protein MVEN_01264000 [Mycena venus]
MEAPQNPPQPNQTPLHPSLPPKPVAGPIITAPHSARGNNSRKSPVKAVPVEQVPAVPQISESTKPSVDGNEPDRRQEGKQDDASSDSGPTPAPLPRNRRAISTPRTTGRRL